MQKERLNYLCPAQKKKLLNRYVKRQPMIIQPKFKLMIINFRNHVLFFEIAHCHTSNEKTSLISNGQSHHGKNPIFIIKTFYPSFPLTRHLCIISVPCMKRLLVMPALLLCSDEDLYYLLILLHSVLICTILFYFAISYFMSFLKKQVSVLGN